MNLEMTEKRLLKILIHGTDKELAEIIEDIHPADILDAIHENENEVGKILNRLPEWMIAAVIEEEDDDEESEDEALLDDDDDNLLDTKIKKILY